MKYDVTGLSLVGLTSLVGKLDTEIRSREGRRGRRKEEIVLIVM